MPPDGASVRVDGPIFTPTGPPSWPGATWIGQANIDARVRGGERSPSQSPAITLDGAAGYAQARLLVREGARVRGFVTVPVVDGKVDHADLQSRIDRLPPLDPPDASAEAVAPEPISVVLCTRERPEALRLALGSVLGQTHANLEVIVVDNAPATSDTRRVVTDCGDDRVTYVVEPRPGLASARNAGVAAATRAWVAFIDDDVLADPGWLVALARSAARSNTRVDVVSGLVPTGELDTPAQAWFDARVGWASSLRPRVYDGRRPPSDQRLFPFTVGAFGTGANFAARRAWIEDLGGFDPCLGAGTPSQGGEDIDFFFRTIARAGRLAYEPDAVIWHRHRPDIPALRAQVIGYGRGLTAWLTKLLLSPRDLASGLRILARQRGRTKASRPGAPDQPPASQPALGTEGLAALERRAMAGGPRAYLTARRAQSPRR